MRLFVIIFASIGTLKKFHTNVEVINHGKEKQDAKDTAVEQAERSAFPELFFCSAEVKQQNCNVHVTSALNSLVGMQHLAC